LETIAIPTITGSATVTQTGHSATTIGGLPNVGGIAFSKFASEAVAAGKKPTIARGTASAITATKSRRVLPERSDWWAWDTLALQLRSMAATWIDCASTNPAKSKRKIGPLCNRRARAG